jgi:uncharacterized DUF497 family protein
VELIDTKNKRKMEKRTISHADILEIISMTAATVHCFAKGEISRNVAIGYIESNTSIRREFKEAIKLVIDELSSPEGSDYDIDKVYETSLPFYTILSIKEGRGFISMKFSFNDIEYKASLERDRKCATFLCERITGYEPDILVAVWDEKPEDVNLQKLMECVRDVIVHLK